MRRMDDRQVGRLLKAIRVRLDLRQADVAERAGVSQTVVSDIELGRLERVGLTSVRSVARVRRGRARDTSSTPVSGKSSGGRGASGSAPRDPASPPRAAPARSGRRPPCHSRRSCRPAARARRSRRGPAGRGPRQARQRRVDATAPAARRHATVGLADEDRVDREAHEHHVDPVARRAATGRRRRASDGRPIRPMNLRPEPVGRPRRCRARTRAVAVTVRAPRSGSTGRAWHGATRPVGWRARPRLDLRRSG